MSVPSPGPHSHSDAWLASTASGSRPWPFCSRTGATATSPNPATDGDERRKSTSEGLMSGGPKSATSCIRRSSYSRWGALSVRRAPAVAARTAPKPRPATRATMSSDAQRLRSADRRSGLTAARPSATSPTRSDRPLSSTAARCRPPRGRPSCGRCAPCCAATFGVVPITRAPLEGPMDGPHRDRGIHGLLRNRRRGFRYGHCSPPVGVGMDVVMR